MVQALSTTQFLVAIFHFELDRGVAGGATVVTDRQLVDGAEAEKTGVATNFVGDVFLCDLIFTLKKEEQTT